MKPEPATPPHPEQKNPSLPAEFRALQERYLEARLQRRLPGLRPPLRWLVLTGWAAKALFLALAPARRLLLLLALVLLLAGRTGFTWRGQPAELDLRICAFLIMTLLLVLELKDKLLERRTDVDRSVVQSSLSGEWMAPAAGWEVENRHPGSSYFRGCLQDVFMVRPGVQALIQVETAGRGLPASFRALRLHAVLQAAAPYVTGLPGLARLLGRWLKQEKAASYATTALYAEMESSSGILRVLNAGHCPPLLIRNGHVEEIMAEPDPPAAERDPGARIRELTLTAGDTLLFHANGLVQARPDGYPCYGREKLFLLAAEAGGHPLAEAARFLQREIEQFHAGNDPADDTALILVRRRL